MGGCLREMGEGEGVSGSSLKTGRSMADVIYYDLSRLARQSRLGGSWRLNYKGRGEGHVLLIRPVYLPYHHTDPSVFLCYLSQNSQNLRRQLSVSKHAIRANLVHGQCTPWYYADKISRNMGNFNLIYCPV